MIKPCSYTCPKRNVQLSVIILFIGLCTSCNGKSFTKLPSNKPKLTYESYLALQEQVKKDKIEMRKKLELADGITTQRLIARAYIADLIINKIAPYWYGTPWDFNGVTTIPNSGKIACGYFITTVLRDAGFKIERVKLAQQAASVIIKNTCEPSSIKTFTKKESAEKYIQQQGKGLYIVGLNCHVIFAYYDGVTVQSIHSNYTGNRVVVKENFNTSQVNNLSDIFVVGSLSMNNKAIDAWILN